MRDLNATIRTILWIHEKWTGKLRLSPENLKRNLTIAFSNLRSIFSDLSSIYSSSGKLKLLIRYRKLFAPPPAD